MPISPHYRAAPRVTELGGDYYDVVAPARFPRHIQRFRNQRWAEWVGLGALTEAEWQEHFAEFQALAGNLPACLALRYHGHQFGSYNPNLGDGRGFLHAQILDPVDGRLLDLGTKGSGQTPWSRGGDGRLTLKGGVREVLAAAMLEALGVYTSKPFSLFETGEELYRNDEPSPTRSSVLVRLSHSHIRFGTFQRYAFLRQVPQLRRLVDYSIEHYFPELGTRQLEDTAAGFLREACRRSAELCASWMIAGFVHGVLNSDNMNITGESFDYGPYRFLPTYDPKFVAAYFDHSGLYAFGRQPGTVLWNLTRLAETLMPLSSQPALTAALEEFEGIFTTALRSRFLLRLGVVARDGEEDERLMQAALSFLAASHVGYDQFYFDWYGGLVSAARAHAGPAASSYAGAAFDLWRQRLEPYAAANPMRLDAPYFQRAQPCSLLYDEIEAVWTPIASDDDWTLFNAKLTAIEAMRRVFDDSNVSPSPR